MQATKRKPEKNKVPAPPPDGRELLTRPEAAFFLGIGTTALDQMVSNGAIPVVKPPGLRRTAFSRRALQRWIDAGMPRVRKGGAA